MNLSVQTEQLAKRAASKTGKTVEEFVEEAVLAHARRAGVEPATAGKRSPAEVIAAIRLISRQAAARPVFDPRSVQDIVEDLNQAS